MPAPSPAPRIVGRTTFSNIIKMLSVGISILTGIGGWACCCEGCDQPAKLTKVRTSKNLRIRFLLLYRVTRQRLRQPNSLRLGYAAVCATGRTPIKEADHVIRHLVRSDSCNSSDQNLLRMHIPNNTPTTERHTTKQQPSAAPILRCLP